MPAPTTVADLAELLRKSNLLDPARLDDYLAGAPGRCPTPADLCARMRADGVLTGFHAEQLLRGKYRGFFLGKYKILDRIGLGGMGQVFLAEHTGMRRRVAIKVLPPDRAQNGYARERFLREARAAGQLDHPNLVRAFDVDGDGDVIFLVMEYVDGVSFHDLVARTGPQSPDRVANYLWQAACGLDYMDVRGLVHRDVKPANLLVDRGGVVKLLDLGLVRSQEEVEELTRKEGVKILGTADYIAPEQAIDCSGVDVRADIYSLGATGYFLLTGRPPFDGDKIAQKLIAHQIKVLRPVHEVRPDVPAGLSAVVARMMAKRPDDRYTTPGELAEALAPWAAVPPALPTDAEIPATPYAPSAVNLSGSRPSPLHPAGSAVVLGGGPGSGSGIRFNTDSNVAVGSRPSLQGPRTPIPRPPAPTPAPPPDLPAVVLTPAPDPRAKFCGSRTHPPLLPAASTHELAAGDPRGGRRIRSRSDRSSPDRPDTGRRFGRRAILAVAALVALAIAAWDLAYLSGAVARPAERRPADQATGRTP